MWSPGVFDSGGAGVALITGCEGSTGVSLRCGDVPVAVWSPGNPESESSNSPSVNILRLYKTRAVFLQRASAVVNISARLLEA